MRERKNGNFQTNNNEISGERNAADRLIITINILYCLADEPSFGSNKIDDCIYMWLTETKNNE